MHGNTIPGFRTNRRHREGGQSLTVAIVVMFLLLFIAGLFIALVINNLRNTKDAAQRVNATKYAEAGLRYLDEQLTKSPEGADWRPNPNDPLGDQNPSADPTDAVNDVDPNDPDYEWLAEVFPGRDGYAADGSPQDFGPYTRVEFGGPTPSQGNLGGRALVRVAYRPVTKNTLNSTPDQKYLRLDSVGRVGSIDPADPTTFGNTEAKGLRRELLAYKAIGLTDYIRWFTNKDNRTVPATIGSVNTVVDTPVDTAGGTRPVTAPIEREIINYFDGPIRANGNLAFYGVNVLTLDARRNDAVEVNGTISLNGLDDAAATVTATDVTRVYLNVAASGVPSVLPSLSANFTTVSGLVRDNPSGGDVTELTGTDKNLRTVARLEAPRLDEPIGPNGLTRYRSLTQFSEPIASKHLTTSDAADLTALGAELPGQVGWGSGLYINNREDVQRESESLLGAYSLRSDWLNPGGSAYWRGDFKYVPPAVTITFHPRYVQIDRSSTSTGRSPFRNPAGRRLSGSSTIIRYSGPGDTAPTAGLPQNGNLVYKFKGYPTEQATVNGVTVNKGELVIFAEGNVRVKGTVGGRDPETGELYVRNITLVSNENIYVDGNLLRDNLSAANPGDFAVQGQSSIALLARNYVAVNSTQFMTPDEGLVKAEEVGSDAKALFLSANAANRSHSVRINAGPIDDKGTSPWGGTTPFYTPRLFMRHSAETNAGTAVSFSLNDTNGVPNPLVLNVPGRVIGAGNASLLLGGPTQNAGAYIDDVIQLDTNQMFPTHTSPVTVGSAVGIDNVLRVYFDISAGISNQSDYRVTRIGVAPLDVRIEALMYAQDRSFFIIPGPWFNPDPNDTYERYAVSDPNRGGAPRLSRSGDAPRTTRINPRYPFYGQPMDIRLTFFGAISENMPAEIGDQAAWLEKWGWIPHYYGSTGLPVAPGYSSSGVVEQTIHGQNSPQASLRGPQGSGAGIVYEYDPRWEAPGSIRQDAYKRQLPLAPRLPTAPGLLYVGEDPQNR